MKNTHRIRKILKVADHLAQDQDIPNRESSLAINNARSGSPKAVFTGMERADPEKEELTNHMTSLAIMLDRCGPKMALELLAAIGALLGENFTEETIGEMDSFLDKRKKG